MDITQDSLQFTTLERVIDRLDPEAAKVLGRKLLKREKRVVVVILPQDRDIFKECITFHYEDLEDLAKQILQEPRKYSEGNPLSHFFVSLFKIKTSLPEEQIDIIIEEKINKRYHKNPLRIISDLEKHDTIDCITKLFYGNQVDAVEFIFENLNQ